jgi:hypothetical protein
MTIDNDNSLAQGVPARHISPETGSFGDATKTNAASTGEGVNESPDSSPAPAAGIETPIVGPDSITEDRSFAPERPAGTVAYPVGGPQTPAQQIADGEDHLDSDRERKKD